MQQMQSLIALAMSQSAAGSSAFTDGLLRTNAIVSQSSNTNPRVLPPINILVQERLHYIHYQSPSLAEANSGDVQKDK